MISEPILWYGKASQKFKKRTLIIAILGNILALFSLFPLYVLAEYNWEIFQIAFFLIIGLLISIDIGILLQYSFNAYARYYLTSITLIKRRWPYAWRRMEQIFEVREVNTIYIVEKAYIDKNDVYFFKDHLDTILQKYPLGKYEIDSFQDFDFWFDNLENPSQFIAALQKVLPLKVHPQLANVYTRIE